MRGLCAGQHVCCSSLHFSCHCTCCQQAKALTAGRHLWVIDRDTVYAELGPRSWLDALGASIQAIRCGAAAAGGTAWLDWRGTWQACPQAVAQVRLKVGV
ncbi:hypothetical protein ABPG77_001499 [Micractinium sp. CCAP 211/92]